MDTRLYAGDHALGGRGLPVPIHGDEEVVQRALIRLQVRRGALPQDPALGSGLHRLRGAPPKHLHRLALAYVQEALAPMPEVTVEQVAVHREGRDDLMVEVVLLHAGQSRVLAVTI